MNKTPLKQTLLTCIGTTLEYYDFVIYMTFITYIHQVFFPAENPATSFLEALGIFALGYIMRPLGGIIFGSLGDRFGRKKIFLASIMLMGVSSFLIGCLPSYQTWGIYSSILLVISRALQGIAQGAELPGAITYIAEHAYKKNKGFFTGILYSSISIGATLSSLSGYCINTLLSNEQILNWGWRLPFLLGGSLSVVAFYFRAKTIETPLFTRDANRQPIKTLLREYKLNCFKGILITLCGASLILLSMFIPGFLIKYYAYESKEVFSSLTIGLLVAALIIPYLGVCADYLSQHHLLKIASLCTLFFLYPLFYLLENHSYYSLLAFMGCYQILIGLFVASFPAYLAELFPTNVRYSGIALCYNTGFTIASVTPIVATWLTDFFDKQIAITLLPISCSLAVLILSLPYGRKSNEIAFKV